MQRNRNKIRVKVSCSNSRPGNFLGERTRSQGLEQPGRVVVLSSGWDSYLTADWTHLTCSLSLLTKPLLIKIYLLMWHAQEDRSGYMQGLSIRSLWHVSLSFSFRMSLLPPTHTHTMLIPTAHNHHPLREPELSRGGRRQKNHSPCPWGSCLSTCGCPRKEQGWGG